MTKVELEAKVGALTDEINFLRCIYEEVRALPSPGLPGVAVRRVVAKDTEAGLRAHADLVCRGCLELLLLSPLLRRSG